MSFSPQELARKRKKARERLDKNRGGARIWREEGASKTSGDYLAKYYEPFVRRTEAGDPGETAAAPPTTTEIKAFLRVARLRWRKVRTPDGAETEADIPTDPSASSTAMDWAAPFRQAGIENFVGTFFKWLGAVPVEHGLSSSPLDDLERMHREAAFRRRVLEAVLRLTEAEYDAVDAEIRARRALNHGDT